MTPAQAALVRRYNELETKNNEVARAEVARQQGGTFKISRPHRLMGDLWRIEKIGDVRERAHAIRELRAKWRDDPTSDYNNVNSPEHKNAVESMRRLYDAEAELPPQPEDA